MRPLLSAVLMLAPIAAATLPPAVALAATSATGQSMTVQTPAPGAPRRRPNADGSMMPAPPPMTLESMLQRTGDAFERMDADRDGVVSAEEMNTQGPGMGQVRGDGGGPRGRGADMLRRADADGDGRITRAEAEAGVRALFARMDADHDGVIGPNERPQWGGGRAGPDGM